MALGDGRPWWLSIFILTAAAILDFTGSQLTALQHLSAGKI